jgi:regulatory subunit for Cdc7p protein kinase
MAAAVCILQSPHDLFSNMATSRRAPLASIPNATNSPHRTLTNSNKRSRASANVFQQENEPPQKRQMVEKLKDSTNPATPRRRMTVQSAEGKVFEAGPTNAEANLFQRKLVAAREKGAPVKTAKSEVQQQKEADSIRQWQKHYRKIFPTFSFYFESIPEDMRARFTRQVTALGAVRDVLYVLALNRVAAPSARLLVKLPASYNKQMPCFLQHTDNFIVAGGEILFQDGDPHRHDSPNTSRDSSTRIFILELYFRAEPRYSASDYQPLTA